MKLLERFWRDSEDKFFTMHRSVLDILRRRLDGSELPSMYDNLLNGWWHRTITGIQKYADDPSSHFRPAHDYDDDDDNDEGRSAGSSAACLASFHSDHRQADAEWGRRYEKLMHISIVLASGQKNSQRAQLLNFCRKEATCLAVAGGAMFFSGTQEETMRALDGLEQGASEVKQFHNSLGRDVEVEDEPLTLVFKKLRELLEQQGRYQSPTSSSASLTYSSASSTVSSAAPTSSSRALELEPFIGWF